ncbi:hypothetical protein B0H11DRAFT_2241590 [Mycena galericulata]|nr:hypothetical protein B0H11DRAFT_2241590 [Mycena galericulata]
MDSCLDSVLDSPNSHPTPAVDLVTDDELILSSFRDLTIAIPSTASDAQKLIHFIRSHRDVCELEHNLALKRLHQTVVYLEMLRDEVNKSGHKLMAADDDLGKVKAAIRTRGVRGVRFGPTDNEKFTCCGAIIEGA